MDGSRPATGRSLSCALPVCMKACTGAGSRVGSTSVCVRNVCQRSSSDGRSVQTSACRTEARQLPLMPSLDRANRNARGRFNVKKPRQLSRACAGSGKGSGRLSACVISISIVAWKVPWTLPWPLRGRYCCTTSRTLPLPTRWRDFHK